MICEVCGCEFDDSLTRCPECGSGVTADTEPADIPQPVQNAAAQPVQAADGSSNSTSNITLIVALTVIITILIASIAALIFLIMNNPGTDTSEALVTDTAAIESITESLPELATENTTEPVTEVERPSVFFISDQNAFTMDTSIFGISWDEAATQLGGEITEPEDFSSLGAGLMRSHIMCDGADISLVFYDDKLVMVMYETPGEMNSDAIDGICDHFNVSRNNVINQGQILLKFPDGNSFHMYEKESADTGELCYYQSYKYKDMNG